MTRDWWFVWVPEKWGELMLEPVIMLVLIGLIIVGIAALLPDDNGDPENYD